MSEEDPINPFRLRRVPLDVAPNTEQFEDDTRRMDGILDDLSQGTLEDFVNISAFTPIFHPDADRPINPDDYLLLMEIVRLRVTLTNSETRRATLSEVLNHLDKAQPNSAARKKPRR